MAEPILMPELGESVHEGTVSRWLKQVGDRVEEDEPIVEIMTDKVNTELQAPASGVLLKILVPEGENVEVFKPLGFIGEEGEIVDEGNGIAKPAPAADVQPQESAPAASQETQVSEVEKRWFSPVVRAMMKEHGLSESEVSSIRGTGEGGRVTRKDVEAYLAVRGSTRPTSPPTIVATKETPAPAPSPSPEPAVAQPAAAPTAAPKPAPIVAGEEQEVIKLTGLRRAIAEAMTRANSIPSVSTVTEVNVSRLVEFRNANKDSFQQMYGVRLTYTPFFIKAVTEALLEYPMLNSSFNDDYTVTVHRGVNMGVAVALGDGSEGLVVPVIRDCHKKTLVEIAKDLETIASKARSGSLEISDMQGATFSLTNPGSYGALFGTPMIPPGQAGILGTYAIKQTPVAENGMIAVRPMMYLVLSYDHRLVDGMLAGMFLKSVRERLERFDFFR
jgi:pyruvate/2-oxoglutarate dehydrogenase complex dihydrolipoamide acyltransferase (E2) component